MEKKHISSNQAQAKTDGRLRRKIWEREKKVILRQRKSEKNIISHITLVITEGEYIRKGVA